MNNAQLRLDAMLSGRDASDIPPATLDEIAAVLDQTKESHARRKCYVMLRKLAVETNATEIGRYAAKMVGREKTQNLKGSALAVVRSTQGVEEFDEILQALEFRKIRHEALGALGACVGPSAEKPLLDILEAACETKHVGDASVCAVALSRMGGKGAIKKLQQIFETVPRKPGYAGILGAIALAFSRHPSKRTTELVLSELSGTRFWNFGWAALHYLYRVKEDNSESIVRDYFDKVLVRIDGNRDILKHCYALFATEFDTELQVCIAILHEFYDVADDYTLQLKEYWSELGTTDQLFLQSKFPSEYSGLTVHEDATLRLCVNG